MTEIYLLALVISLASGLAILMRRLRQPLVVSYLLAGGLLSLFGLVRPEQLQFLAFLPEIGLAFLLFLVGMELDLGEFRTLGKNVLVATVCQVAIATGFFWLLLGNWVLALALAFSSTILVVKLLLEGKEISALHGKLAVGILLTEDMLAVLALMFISSARLDVLVLLKGLFLIWLAIFAGKKLLPNLFRLTADNTELLFLTGIGWCLLFVSGAAFLGFSVGIGAFLAGVSLAQSVYRSQISSRIKPLRDFFIMIFFIDLGTGLSFSALSGLWGVTLAILAYVILIKPLIFFLTFVVLRFRVHTAFQTGILLSSISEFSLIILVVAARAGLVGKEFLSPVIFAAVVSFVLSSLLVTHKQLVYRFVKIWGKRLERSGAVSMIFFPKENQAFSDHAILVGCHRSGSIILATMRKTYGDNLI
ncbi:cation:proton antiporter, partial [Candidatus Microgenomates bacterium]|nr:cation:proton antiporter [Candidatus Microgenomates bacterium]